MPIGLTMLMFALTVPLTYCVAPNINNKFEERKILSTYIIRNLDTFNDNSRILMSDITTFNGYLKNNNHVNEEIKSIILARISEVLWKTMELDIIFRDQEAKQIISDYRNSIDHLRKAVSEAESVAGIRDISIAVSNYTEHTKSIMEALLSKTGIDVDFNTP